MRIKNLVLVIAMLSSATTFAGPGQIGSSNGDNLVMSKCGGMSLDLAESSLRILLNRPASGEFSKEWMTSDAKLQASMMLLNFEQRFPGCLGGAHGDSSWEQYNEVRALFNEVSQQFQFIK